MGFRTEGGAFDVQGFLNYIRTNEAVESAEAAPTGMRNLGPPEFHVTTKDVSNAEQKVLGAAVLAAPERTSVNGRQSDDGVVFAVYDH